jgi:hypothetical protein
MTTYFGLKNNNKVTERSPDYLVSRSKEENQEEEQNIGIIYLTKSRKGVEYLKVMMDGDEGDFEARKTYFGFRNKNKKDENNPNWFLFPPKKNEDEKRNAVGSIFEDTGEDGKLYFRLTFFNDSDGKNCEGMEPRKSNLWLSSTDTKDLINLDDICDPYDRAGSYYVVEITRAQPYRPNEKEGIESIGLELVIQEKCGQLDEKEKYKFKGKILSIRVSRDPKRVWFLKNLCTALAISGTHLIYDLCRMLLGKRVRASVMTNVDLEAESFYRIIRDFKKAN